MYTPPILQGQGLSVDSAGNIIITTGSDAGQSIGSVATDGSGVLFEQGSASAVESAGEEAGTDAIAEEGVGAAGGAATAALLVLAPTNLSVGMGVSLCADGNSDDFLSFSSNCQQSLSYKSTTPSFKLDWNIISEDPSNTVCSTYGSWNEGIVPGTGSETFNINKSVGHYYFGVVCELSSTRSIFNDLITANLGQMLADIWTSIWGGSLKETVDKFSEVSVNLVSAPPPPPTLSVSLTADNNSLTIPSNGTSATANLTAVLNSNQPQDTTNYTFYCNRPDAGTNITSPYDGKLDGQTADAEYQSCTYNSPGVYTAKVVVEQGNLASQDQTVIVVTKAAPPPVGQVLGTNTSNSSCSVSGWTYDPSNPSQSTGVSVYRDGTSQGSGVYLGNFPAASASPNNIDSTYGISGNHGFSANLSGISDGKSHNLYVYGLNASGANPALLTGSPQIIQCSGGSSNTGNNNNSSLSPSVGVKILD
jgi:hypothetical protein